MRRMLLASSVMALALLGGGAAAQPVPGTWAVGASGFSNLYNIDRGAPSVRYVATDNLALELKPTFSWNRQVQGLTVQTSEIDGVTLDVLRKIADYRGFRLSGLLESGYIEDYTRFDEAGGPVKDKDAYLEVGAGVELEYFLTPRFSLAARGLFPFYYVAGATNGQSGSNKDILRTGSLGGELLDAHYYFGGAPAAASEAAPADSAGTGPAGTRPGSWAIGWMGIGALYNITQPSLKYVLSDKTAFELIPQLTGSHDNNGNALAANSTYATSLDAIRALAVGRATTFSAVIEPSLGYAYSQTSSPGVYTKSPTWTFGLAAGVEAEYFVVPSLSLGARMMLAYGNMQATSYSNQGYQGATITNSLSLEGQVLIVRWYFK